VRNRLVLLIVSIASAGALAACAGSSTTSTPTPVSGQGGGGFQAYATCLSQHGVTLPSRGTGTRTSRAPGARSSRQPGARPSGRPGGGFGFGSGDQPPAGVDAETWQKAQAACASVRPSGGPRGGGAGRNSGAFTAYRNCLSDHGLTMSAGPGGYDQNDPKVAAAMTACAPLRPSTRPTPTA
jgi:hypothetical protein